MLAFVAYVLNNENMTHDLQTAYRAALRKLNISEVARETSRSRRVLTMYMSGERGITDAAARELIDFLRSSAQELSDAADDLEAALPPPQLKGGDRG